MHIQEGKDLTQEAKKEQEVFGRCFVPSEQLFPRLLQQ